MMGKVDITANMMKSYEEYKKEPTYEQFGDFLHISDPVITPEIRKESMKIVADILLDSARITGRKPTKFFNWLEVNATVTKDSLGLYATCAGKMWLELDGSPEAYAHRIHEVASGWIAGLEVYIQDIQTWKGFFKYQLGKLKKKFIKPKKEWWEED